jgi:hypothetical protein
MVTSRDPSDADPKKWTPQIDNGSAAVKTCDNYDSNHSNHIHSFHMFPIFSFPNLINVDKAIINHPDGLMLYSTHL